MNAEALKLGILGWPLKHTLSPRLHAEIMRIAGVEGEYKAYETPPEDLSSRVSELAASGIRGLNVTIPHKVSVMTLLDTVSQEATLAGAVNTIVFNEDGRHTGHNTDITGFLRSLPENITSRLPESRILVLGAGGSARAVLHALIQLNTREITFAVRRPDKAIAITANAELLKRHYGVKTMVNVASLPSLPSLEGFGGLINTTPVGMWPEITASPVERRLVETLPTSAFVYDLIYRPLETQLMTDAAVLGHPVFNGLDMLILQGVAAFELWHGQAVPTSALPQLRQSLTQALEA